MKPHHENRNYSISIRFMHLLFHVVILFFIMTGPLHAKERMERDTDKDGKIDQIRILGPKGELLRVESDSDRNGRMDHFQYYEKDILVRLERDLDGDGKTDVTDIFEKGKRVRQERNNARGKTLIVTTFDGDDRPLSMKKDSKGRGWLDQCYTFEKGVLKAMTEDTDGDGKTNVRVVYGNNLPRQKTVDRDNDGRLETEVFYNAKGQPEKSNHDLSGDGTMETARFYENGEIVRQEKTGKTGGKPETITFYSRGVPREERKDTDRDGSMDIFLVFDEKGRARESREVNKKGELVRLRTFRDGKPDYKEYYTRNGKIERSEEFELKTGRLITAWFYDKTENPVRATQDANGDGRMDTVFHYNKGHLVQITEDGNKDGKPDAWETYDEAEVLVSIKQDLDYDGVPDVVKSKEGTKRLLADGKTAKQGS